MAHSRSRAAAGMMLGYVVLQSFLPLVVAFGGESGPFLFNAAWRAGELLGFPLLTLAFFRKRIFSRAAWKAVCRRSLCFAMFLWIAGSFALALYAWATKYIDVAVAAALFETWPVFLVVLTGRLFRQEARYRKATLKTAFVFGFAVLGTTLVIASQAGGFGAFVSSRSEWSDLLTGVALTMGAVGLVALSAYGFRWAADVASELSATFSGASRSRLELFGAVAGLMVVDLVSTPLIALAGVARGEELPSGALVWGIAGGLLIGCGGATLWRMANMVSDNLAINALSYAAPALALAWLFAFSLVGDVSVEYLVIGVAAIIAACAGCLER